MRTYILDCGIRVSVYEEHDSLLFPSKVATELVSTKTGKHIGDLDIKINSSRTNCHVVLLGGSVNLTLHLTLQEILVNRKV